MEINEYVDELLWLFYSIPDAIPFKFIANHLNNNKLPIDHRNYITQKFLEITKKEHYLKNSPILKSVQ